jgi:hypothetical protein
LSIYGIGDVRSPHFLSSPMSLIELWRTYPGILGPHDMNFLVKSGQIVFDQDTCVFVEPPKKVEAVVAPAKKTRARKKK